MPYSAFANSKISFSFASDLFSSPAAVKMPAFSMPVKAHRPSKVPMAPAKGFGDAELRSRTAFVAFEDAGA